MQMFRQGDILLIKRDFEPPEIGNHYFRESKQSETDVLMKGSMTGHHHKLLGARIFFKEKIERGELIFAYAVVDKEAMLIHDEHKKIVLPAGVYEVRRQREVSGYVQD